MATETTTALTETETRIAAVNAAREAVANAEAALKQARDALKLAEGRVDPIDMLLAGSKCTDARRETLQLAIDAGAPRKTLVLLRDAVRVTRAPRAKLPRGRYQGCSRGRDWCRQGSGKNAVWAQLNDDETAYLVGPGKWSVGSTDGFKRKSERKWIVKAIQVGSETWTVAK
jgi:hypothetical protein